ncbi:hypothetical protein [Microbacterium sp. Se63.02b]|uniref:hypothetical protein n=2 Tax=unclassified Microbacterium TaxID=2609290 RepID=UPI001AED1A94|nr:hypothetical protein [Microbacterium sp. Se63.02b]
MSRVDSEYEKTTDVLSRVVADLEAMLRSEAIAEPNDDVKMAVPRKAGAVRRRLDAVIVETVASVDARPARGGGERDRAFCVRFGCRRMNELLQRMLRTNAAGASRVVKAEKAVRRDDALMTSARFPARWPALRTALVDGAVGIGGLLAAVDLSNRAVPA